MRLRNISGYALEIRRYHIVVGPGEVIDTDQLVADGVVHDMAVHGVITGFEPVADAPAAKKSAGKAGKPGETGEKEVAAR